MATIEWDPDDLMDVQEHFIMEVEEEYGAQTFRVTGASLPLCLADLWHKMKTIGLVPSRCASMEEAMDLDEDVEYHIDVNVGYDSDGSLVVGVYPIFPEG